MICCPWPFERTAHGISNILPSAHGLSNILPTTFRPTNLTLRIYPAAAVGIKHPEAHHDHFFASCSSTSPLLSTAPAPTTTTMRHARRMTNDEHDDDDDRQYTPDPAGLRSCRGAWDNETPNPQSLGRGLPLPYPIFR